MYGVDTLEEHDVKGDDDLTDEERETLKIMEEENDR